MLAISGIIILGLVSGSLINYLSDVLPQTGTLSLPICTSCKNNIPWTNYIFLKKCQNCSVQRTIRSWLVQLWMPAAFLILWLSPPEHLGFPIAAALLTYLTLIFVIDLEYRLILSSTILFGCIFGALLGFKLHSVLPTIFGSLFGFLILLVLYFLGKGFVWVMSRIRNQPTEEVALGFGDVNLSIVLGLMLGFPGITLGLLLGILLGGVTSAIFILFMMIRKKYQPMSAIPYAPFLILGALILLYR